MTAPDRIYRGVTVGGRVVYQDSPPSEDQLVWPWEAYTRPTQLAEALAVPEVKALVEALRLLHDNVVLAFPALADLGPVANARAALSAITEATQ